MARQDVLLEHVRVKFLKPSAGIALGLMVVTACTTHPIGSRSSPTASSLSAPTPAVSIPVVSPAPVISGGFNPAQVVQVLGPAVAELILSAPISL